MAEVTKIVISAIFFHGELWMAWSLDSLILRRFSACLVGVSGFFVG
jgi:hypothetical protein